MTDHAQRFIVRYQAESKYSEACWELFDTVEQRVVGTDGGAPEDQLLVRDWSWVAVELNKLHDHATQAHAQGRRAGLEEAAGICEAEALVDDKRGYYGNEMAKAIRVRANEIIQQAKRP